MRKRTLIRMLLVEDNAADIRLIKEMLRDSNNTELEMSYAENLSDCLAYIERQSPEVVLLDMSLPDSEWPDTLIKVIDKAPDVPIVVLTGLDDEERALEAVQKGAQDYLVKNQIDTNLLLRTMRYAIERHKMSKELRAMSLTDELTGIYNRRGFLTLAQQQLKIALRLNSELLLIFADMDGMKWINDNLGHNEGDNALIDTAEILKRSFRESDIIARMGGDEFAVIALEEPGVSDGILTTRLQQNIDNHNVTANRPYKLSLSIGIVDCDPSNSCSIEELLSQADSVMYEHKRKKKRSVA